MESLDDTPHIPDAETLWAETNNKRAQVLEEVCGNIIDNFVLFQFTRETTVAPHDKIYDYNTKLLSLGCFYLEFCDAIREGDGIRVHRCWKYLLPIFKVAGRKNYCLEALHLLSQYEYELTPRDANKLLWSRFVNTHGTAGRNIPGDLCLEHLNRICKDAMSQKGSNQSEKSLIFVGKVLGVLNPVLQQYDLQNHVTVNSGGHKQPNSKKDMNILINNFRAQEVFIQTGMRKYNTFSNPKNLLHGKNAELLEWMKEHLS